MLKIQKIENKIQGIWHQYSADILAQLHNNWNYSYKSNKIFQEFKSANSK